MKKTILFTLLIFSAFFSIAQNIKTDRFEVFLDDYMTSEVNISKGMYMTQNKQFFYEGKIEVNYIDSNTTKMISFYFSTWDSNFKEFYAKDLKNQLISPRFSFKDNNTIQYVNANGKVSAGSLNDNSTVEYAILSSTLFWLNSYTDVTKEVKKDVKPIKDVKLDEVKESDVSLDEETPAVKNQEVVKETQEKLTNAEDEKDEFEKKLEKAKKEKELVTPEVEEDEFEKKLEKAKKAKELANPEVEQDEFEKKLEKAKKTKELKKTQKTTDSIPDNSKEIKTIENKL